MGDVHVVPDVEESRLGGILLIPQNELPVGDRPQHIIPPLEDSIVPPAVLLSLLFSQPVDQLARPRRLEDNVGLHHHGEVKAVTTLHSNEKVIRVDACAVRAIRHNLEPCACALLRNRHDTCHLPEADVSVGGVRLIPLDGRMERPQPARVVDDSRKRPLGGRSLIACCVEQGVRRRERLGGRERRGMEARQLLGRPNLPRVDGKVVLFVELGVNPADLLTVSAETLVGLARGAEHWDVGGGEVDTMEDGGGGLQAPPASEDACSVRGTAEARLSPIPMPPIEVGRHAPASALARSSGGEASATTRRLRHARR
jgi:hypothetical protein